MKKSAQPLDRPTAAEYATWFKALADATRIQIVSLLARRGTPMSVGEIVAAVDVGQSTVSTHLKVLADVRFVLADPRGPPPTPRTNRAGAGSSPPPANTARGNPAPRPPASAAST